MFGLVISDKVKGFLLKAAVVLIAFGLVWAIFKMFEVKNERIKNLNTQVSNQVKELKDLNEKYDAAKAELAKKASSDKVTDVVKQNVTEAEIKQEKAKTQAAKYVEDKVAAINEKYSKLEQTKANAERKAVEVSLERSKGLWLTYCLQAPEESACK